ncbi:MAG: N-6 DNA methylase [Akkermansia sp.]|nr:N-6 DNA methylase [Akkermansia sp.]
MSTERKKTGSFYTPPAWARELAARSLGRTLAELRRNFCNQPQAHAAALATLRVLDPACGKGALLCAAAELLLAEYTSLGISSPDLSHHLCGVDISDQAVASTRAALAPWGGGNIRQGNALVSDSNICTHPIAWEQAYPEIATTGGFDVIIANPPYVFTRGHKLPPAEDRWLREHYPLARYQLNLYGLFTELCYRLLRPGGRAALLIPNTWLTIRSFTPLRRHLLSNAADLHITNIRGQIFDGAAVDACITSWRQAQPDTLHFTELKEDGTSVSCTLPAHELCKGDAIIAPLALNEEQAELLRAINESSQPLSHFATISSGLKVYERGKGTPPQTAEQIKARAFHHTGPPGPGDLPWLDGRDVKRFELAHSRGLYLRMGAHLAAMRPKVDFSAPRILVRQIPAKLPYCIHAAYTEAPAACDLNCHIVHNFRGLHPLALLALINSPLTSLWFAATFGKLQRRTFPQFKVRELAQFPIPRRAGEFEQQLIALAQPGRDAELTALHRKLIGL